jgi:two-component system, cell cycle sensor histidine kinase and response regulator CckA
METILLVDDEPTVLGLCQRVLQLGGYSVLPMASPEAALRYLQDNRAASIDLALLDVMMPGMNGIELANQIKSRLPEIKIVLMSGFGPKEIARVVGDNPYRIVWKPFRADSLLRMIENAMADAAGSSA